MGYNNLAEMFYKTCEKWPEKTGMMYKTEGKYHSIQFQEMASQVRKLAGGLAALNLKKGDKVILLSENRFEWAFSDYAILSNGAASVPIYATLLASSVKYIINDSDAKIVIISNAEQFNKILEVESEIPAVEKFILIEPEGLDHDKVMSFEQVKEEGEKYLADNPDHIANKLNTLNRDDLATIIYTSGTTGVPKGVMITHGNMLSNIEGGIQAIPVSEEDTFLSFLPLSHVFERMVGHFLANHIGASIGYAESVDTVAENLGEVRPTLMASVPRIFEKIYARVLESVEEGSALKRKLFYWAIEVGRQVAAHRQQNKPLPGGLNFKHKIANKLVFSKLQQRVGGRVRFFVSGGAPLSKEIGEFFAAAGLIIVEGYGLTETSPVIAVNHLDRFKFGTVGLPLHNVEVKIAEDGEILTRGPHVMKGYYKKDAETKEVLDEDGWFHTGDIGKFDEDRFLVITDRKKNIIVTAGGKNVAPQKTENMLVMSRYIEQALVIGDQRRFCSALIVPNFENLEKYATEKSIPYGSHKDLTTTAEIRSLIQEEVEKVNQECAAYESVKKFLLLDQPFSIESGELTPSLKIKRRMVEQNYKAEIDSMYKEEAVRTS